MSYRRLAALFWSIIILLGSCSKKGDTPAPPPPPVPGCATNTAPVNGTFVPMGAALSLSWTPVNGATAYDVFLGASSSTATVIASNVTGTTYSYNVPVFASSQPLYWYVQPKNAGGATAGCSSTISSFTAAPAPFGYYVVGYFPSYRSLADVPDVKFRMTNVVVYAFYAVNGSGGLSAPSAPAASLSAVLSKARTNNAKVFLGINDGSGDGKTNFRNMAATATGRNNFIKEVMNVVRANTLDGVDVDWEFPTTADGTDLTFTALIKELSDSLHRDARYYLSAAITAGKCVLGLPAYGRPSGITQTNTILTYKAILAQGGNPQYDSAVVTAGGFTNYTIYYNGQYTVKRKAKLAKDIAAGVMMWEKWQDAADGNSLLKAACDTVGRSY